LSGRSFCLISPMPSPKEEGLLANELARIIGAPKSSEVVVQCISVLCGGDLAFLDGIELSQLEMCLPAAVAIPRGSVGLWCHFKVKLVCAVFRECYGIAQNSRLSKARGIICPQRSNHLSSLPLPHHTHRTL
jgi:hypothetical protein